MHHQTMLKQWVSSILCIFRQNYAKPQIPLLPRVSWVFVLFCCIKIQKNLFSKKYNFFEKTGHKISYFLEKIIDKKRAKTTVENSPNPLFQRQINVDKFVDMWKSNGLQSCILSKNGGSFCNILTKENSNFFLFITKKSQRSNFCLQKQYNYF